MSFPGSLQPGEGSAHPPRDPGAAPGGELRIPLTYPKFTRGWGQETSAAGDGGQREAGQENG